MFLSFEYFLTPVTKYYHPRDKLMKNWVPNKIFVNEKLDKQPKRIYEYGNRKEGCTYKFKLTIFGCHCCRAFET